MGDVDSPHGRTGQGICQSQGTNLPMLALPVKHRLILFSDDWGRHPSSSQHLTARLVKRYPVLWVNTIGMRSPSLNREDLGKAISKLKSWILPKPSGETTGQGQSHHTAIPANMTVINPRMWPGYRTNWQRRINAGQVTKAIHQTLGPRQPDERRIAITTLPVTADLIGRLDVDRWVYYCVDDFSVWPGVDGGTMRELEAIQIAKADKLVAVSENLQKNMTQLGRHDSILLTHGIDLNHWSPMPAGSDEQTAHSSLHLERYFEGLTGPIFLFWGLIDPRLDLQWCQAISEAGLGNLVLVGPQQSPDASLATMRGVRMPGPASYNDLPALARKADVLVMPYADLPVTRAMQPLKFKEYLATGKPVVGRNLPGIREWADAADLVEDHAAFVAAARQRLADGISPQQSAARERLKLETWDHKALEFERAMLEPRA